MVQTRSFGKRSFVSRGSRSSRVSSRSLVPVSAKKADLNQARTIQKLVRITKGIQPEVKLFDQSLTLTNVTVAAGSVSTLNSIGQGDSVATRTGNKIRAVHLDVMVVYSTASAGNVVDPTLGYRWFVIRDTQTSGDTAPTTTDYLASSSAVHQPLLNVNQINRFKTLFDSGFQSYSRIQPVVAATGLSLGAPTMMPFKRFRKRLSIMLEYNGTTSADFQKNSIHLVLISNAAADTADFTGTSRLLFTDA